MKTITAHDHDLITSVVGEGLTTLPEAVLEKDLLVTEALRAIEAFDGASIDAIFCGGTCLSKAHGLTDRMSEDIDFKLRVSEGLSRNARSRALSHYKQRMIRHLEDLGFHIPPEEVIARDENSYIGLNIHYQSRFAQQLSLRPEIKVELNAHPPSLPTTRLNVGSMLDRFIPASPALLSLKCISIEETLAEKVLAFLRRTAQMQSGRNRAEYDDRLVRHLYDVAAIARATETSPLLYATFQRLALQDARQFRNQHPEFNHDPAGEMGKVIEALRDKSDPFERHYQEFVEELVYGEPISFTEAKRVFIVLAEKLVGSITPNP